MVKIYTFYMLKVVYQLNHLMEFSQTPINYNLSSIELPIKINSEKAFQRL